MSGSGHADSGFPNILNGYATEKEEWQDQYFNMIILRASWDSYFMDVAQ